MAGWCNGLIVSLTRPRFVSMLAQKLDSSRRLLLTPCEYNARISRKGYEFSQLVDFLTISTKYMAFLSPDKQFKDRGLPTQNVLVTILTLFDVSREVELVLVLLANESRITQGAVASP